MSRIGIHRRTVRELHYSGELVPQGTRGEVHPHIRLKNARDLALQSADLVLSALFLRLCDTGFPSKEEGVDDHAAIIVSRPSQIDCFYGLIRRSSCQSPELAIIGEVVVEGCNVEDTIDDGSAGKHSSGL